jgi:hypothetical protein
VLELPLVFGSPCPSARHPWELFNANGNASRIVKTFVIPNHKTYLQLGWFEGESSAAAFCWGEAAIDTVGDVLCFANRNGLQTVFFYGHTENVRLLAGFKAKFEGREYEIYKNILP